MVSNDTEMVNITLVVGLMEFDNYVIIIVMVVGKM